MNKKCTISFWYRLLKVFELNYKDKESIKNLLSWLLNETKPIWSFCFKDRNTLSLDLSLEL